MAKRNRRRYTDDFRASASVMLESQGYPEQKGALTSVANHLDVPLSTLRGWFLDIHNPPPTEVRNEKKGDLVALLKTEALSILGDMPNAREFAEYRELGTVLGIVIDKLQLLEGKPTERVVHEDWRSEAIAYTKEGRLKYEAVADEFGATLAGELFKAAGIVIEVAKAETTS